MCLLGSTEKNGNDVSPENRTQDDADALRRRLGGGTLSLDAEDIQRLLPHEPSMIMVDRVMTFVPQHHGVGLKAISGNEYGLCRRDHGFVFPATLGVECLAQLAALVWLYPKQGEIPKEAAPELREDGSIVGSLGEVQSIEVHSELVNPDRLSLEVSVLEIVSEREVLFRGDVSVQGTPTVSARFTLLL